MEASETSMWAEPSTPDSDGPNQSSCGGRSPSADPPWSPVSSEPVSSEPVSSQPVSTNSVSTKSVSTKSLSTKSLSSEPLSIGSATHAPASPGPRSRNPLRGARTSPSPGAGSEGNRCLDEPRRRRRCLATTEQVNPRTSRFFPGPPPSAAGPASRRPRRPARPHATTRPRGRVVVVNPLLLGGPAAGCGLNPQPGSTDLPLVLLV